MEHPSTTKQIGDLGERLAADYLVSCGHEVLNRNYWQKWGEIDLVTKTSDLIHFVEVKSVSYETKSQLEWAVSHETWRPEEQVHERKIHQISKALETWIEEYNYEGEWQIDVIAVRIVPRETFCTINYLENITL